VLCVRPRCYQKHAHKERKKSDLLDQQRHIIRCIWPRSSRLSQRPRPVFIGSLHVGWHRVKSVASKRIRNVTPLPVWHCDFYFIEADDLRRRNTILRPIPVCEPQLEGRIYPLCFVRSSVRCGNLSCMLIDDLLEKNRKKKKKKVITSTCDRRLELTSTSIVNGLCQVGNKVEP